MNWLMVVSSITATIAAIVIALATWKYTTYSKKTLDEFKKQREFSIISDKQKYELERRALCKRLLYEINENEVTLKYLFVFFNSKPDSFPKIWDHFEKIKYRNLFKDNIYKIFIESNIDFKNNKIFENLYYLYSYHEYIQNYMDFVMSKDKTLKLSVLELFLVSILKPIRESLQKIKDLYELFKEETGYNHKESNYYEERQTEIKFLEIKKF